MSRMKKTMSDLSSFPSLPYGAYYKKPHHLRGGDASSTDGAIIAMVVVVIVILLVAIILAACWNTSCDTETIYVTGPDGQPLAAQVPKSKSKKMKMRADKALKDLPPLTPHRRSGKSYDLAAPGDVTELSSEADARALLNPDSPAAMVFIYMDGCGFCDRAKQHFTSALAKEHSGVKLAKIHASKCQALCQEKGITGFPTFLTNFGNKMYVGYKAKDVMDGILRSAAQHMGQKGGMRLQGNGGNGGSVVELVDDAHGKGADKAKAMLQNKGQKALLFLYAPWCGYCKKQQPVLHELAKAYPHIQFAAINAEEAGKAITQAMKVSGFPTFISNFGHAAHEDSSMPKVSVGFKDRAAMEAQLLA